MKRNNQILALVLTLALMVGILPGYAANSPFSDVPTSHWAYKDVMAADQDGVINGVGNGRFDPESNLTIAEWSCILARAFYAEEVEAKPKKTWYDREMDTLASHTVFAGMFDEIEDVSAYASRSLMAAMVSNVLSDKRVEKPSKADLAAFQAGIVDIDAIPQGKREAVAECYTVGILNGVGGNRFDGAGHVQRGAAAAVYNRTKKVIQEGGHIVVPVPDPEPTPEPTLAPGESHVVGTMSSVKVTLDKDNVKTHAPIVDCWSQQPAEIRVIADKDYFNAACQTIKDTELMTTQGSLLPTGVNPYYNYAVVATNSSQAAINVNLAMGNLSMKGCTYLGTGNTGYVYRYARPLRSTTTSAPRFAATIASFTPETSDRAKAEGCVRAVCDQIDYENNGGASWDNGGTKGDCTSYARMAAQILAAAGLPNIHMAGKVQGGGHAWVQCYLPDEGQWFIIDTVSADSGYNKIMTMSEHEQHWGDPHSTNDTDSCRVAKALVEIFF